MDNRTDNKQARTDIRNNKLGSTLLFIGLIMIALTYLFLTGIGASANSNVSPSDTTSVLNSLKNSSNQANNYSSDLHNIYPGQKNDPTDPNRYYDSNKDTDVAYDNDNNYQGNTTTKSDIFNGNISDIDHSKKSRNNGFKYYVNITRKDNLMRRYATGLKQLKIKTTYPTMQLLSKKSVKHSNKIKYTVRLNNKVFDLTEKKDNLYSAYYVIKDFNKAKSNLVKTNNTIVVYNKKNNHKVKTLKRGSVIAVKGVNTRNGKSKLMLSKNLYITGNKYFVSIVK